MSTFHTFARAFAPLALFFGTAACDQPTDVEPVPIGQVEVTTGRYTLGTVEPLQLHVTVRDTSGTALPDHPVTWSSADTTIATVNQSGLVQGRRSGIVWITATAGDKKGGVSLQVHQVRITLPDSLVLTQGTPWEFLRAGMWDEDRPLIGWSADFTVQDSTVVRLAPCEGACTGSTRGMTVRVIPLNTGTTSVIASWGGVSDTTRVRVTP